MKSSNIRQPRSVGSRAHRVLLWTSCVLLIAAPAARGQTKAGTAIGEFLLIEPSARVAGMGNAGVAFESGLQSVYYNPAAIGSLDRFGAQVTHSEWLAGINYDYAAVGLPILPWARMFVSLTSLSSGDMAVRTVEQPHGTGELFSVSDIAIGLGVGRRITDRFAVGVQGNFVQESIWNTSMRTFTFNVGTLYRLSPNGLHLGAGVNNIGTDGRFSGRDLAIQYDADPSRYGDNSALPADKSTDSFPLPVLFRVGLGMPWQLTPQTRLSTEVDVFHPSDNTEAASTGFELTWKDAYSLRAGFQNLGQRDSETGVTLGGGVQLAVAGLGFQVDYAWADQGRLEQTHRMTLVVLF